jgi:prepilin-type N-terminal cleavage/methylation domain-containing protein
MTVRSRMPNAAIHSPAILAGSVVISLREMIKPLAEREAHTGRRARMTRLYKRGVTLVELLITMAIMAIIAAAIMGTARAAMESARRSRTQTLITRISGLVTEQLATYSTRRVDIHPEIVQALDQYVATGPGDRTARLIARGQMMADARLLAVRELVKMEMPDTWEDIDHQPLILQARPSLSESYRRRYKTAQAAEFDSAECLYMTVMSATGDGEARTFFAAQDIGDVDNDGAPEFLDGWQQPINWIRWPAGFVSPLQPIDPDTGLRAGDDPLDPYRRDRIPDPPASLGPLIGAYPQVTPQGRDRDFRGIYEDNIRERLEGPAPPVRKNSFALTPLIYSQGPDGESAYLIKEDPTIGPLDPFYIMDDSGELRQVGEPHPDSDRAEALADNIHNHINDY